MKMHNMARRRGDFLVPLNSTKLSILGGSIFGALILVFALGYHLGRSSGAAPAAEQALAATLENEAAEPTPVETSPSEPTTAAPPSVTRAIATQPTSATSGDGERPTERAQPAPPAPAARPASPASASTTTASAVPAEGQRYSIVAGSVPIGTDEAAAKAEADRRLAELKTKGFRSARAERVTVAGKGEFYRIVARDGTYPSVNAAFRDIEAMKRRGELTSAWPMKSGGSR